MRDVQTIPCPPATARIGWTVYERGTGRIMGWIRRAADNEARAMPEDSYWVIPRTGPGDPAAYVSVRHAGQSPFLT